MGQVLFQWVWDWLVGWFGVCGVILYLYVVYVVVGYYYRFGVDDVIVFGSDVGQVLVGLQCFGDSCVDCC